MNTKTKPAATLRLRKGSPEHAVFVEAVNQGIDAYLQAVTESHFEDCGSVLQAELGKADAETVCRRLYELHKPEATELAARIQRQVLLFADLDKVTEHYVIAALWVSYDDHGDPLEDNYDIGDLAPKALSEIRDQCFQFCDDNAADIELAGLAEDQVGHDFWLTRNGHGSGFWDRGLGDVGKRLSEAAKAWGSQDLYIGDDGLIYVS